MENANDKLDQLNFRYFKYLFGQNILTKYWNKCLPKQPTTEKPTIRRNQKNQKL